MFIPRLQVTRLLQFCYGHRLLRHESKCAGLHGHQGNVEITCAAKVDYLDPVGRVVDFSVVKEVVGSWIDAKLDHTMILNKQACFYSAPTLDVTADMVKEMDKNFEDDAKKTAAAAPAPTATPAPQVEAKKEEAKPAAPKAEAKKG